MKQLRIAANLSLPLEAVTQTFGVLAKRRAGKSYTARRFAEQLLKAGQQVVIIDPKGDWWGIRSSADGKAPGFPVVILGGERGDVKLEPGGGEVVAKLVVEERVSIVLDLSGFRKNEVASFMGGPFERRGAEGFLEALYRLKAREQYRTPVMLIIDEADAIAPQKPQKGEERMLGAAEDIVRRGGQRGIGCICVTQRSAVLNKNVLTQSQVLVALRTIAPQDLEAMDAWIDVHGTEEERKTLMASLPALPTGEAWFWSPGWPTDSGVFARVKVLPIETFDSGATPKPGEKRVEPKNLADIDLAALSRQMAATIERAKSEDPKELRRQIAELKKQLALKSLAPVEKLNSPIRDTPVLTDADRARIEKLQQAVRETTTAIAEKADVMLNSIAERAKDAIDDSLNRWLQEAARARIDFMAQLEKPSVQKVLAKVAAATPGVQPRALYAPERTKTADRPRPAPRQPRGDSGDGLPPPQQAILNTVAMLNVRGLDVHRESVARWLGIHPNGGRYGTNLAWLRAEGYLDEDGWTLTPKGAGAAGPLDTGLEAALAALPDESKRTVLSKVVELEQTTREQLADALSIHPNGGRYGTNLAWLRTMGVITARGPIAPTDGLFR